MKTEDRGCLILGRVMALGETIRLTDNEGRATAYELIRVDQTAGEAVLWVFPPGEELTVELGPE